MTINNWNSTQISVFFIASILLLSCEPVAPKQEDTPETITKVTLTFTPTVGEPVTVSATDPDKEGPKDIVVDHDIQLMPVTTYVLSIDLINQLHQPGEDGYSITEEVNEESDEHQFFYAWTSGLFSNPTGNGNITEQKEIVNYLDQDSNELPLGLKTKWTTGEPTLENSKSTIRVLLKHQPEIKSKNSSANDGESDLDLTFNITIK